MVRLLRRLSGISLIVVVATALLIGLDIFSPNQSIGIVVAFVVATMSVSGLCFAVGVIGLVISGSRRQWGWFIALLIPLILVNYGPRLFFVDSQLNAAFYTSPQQFDLIVFALTGALPAVIPVLALVYCHVIERPPESAHVADDGLELEYSAISDPDPSRHSGM